LRKSSIYMRWGELKTAYCVYILLICARGQF
jgi:hypothetical protein